MILPIAAVARCWSDIGGCSVRRFPRSGCVGRDAIGSRIVPRANQRSDSLNALGSESCCRGSARSCCCVPGPANALVAIRPVAAIAIPPVQAPCCAIRFVARQWVVAGFAPRIANCSRAARCEWRERY